MDNLRTFSDEVNLLVPSTNGSSKCADYPICSAEHLCQHCLTEYHREKALRDNSPPPRVDIQRDQRHQSIQSAQTAQRIQTPPGDSDLSDPSDPSDVSDPSVYTPAQGGNTETVRRLIFRLCRRLKAEGRDPDDTVLGDYFRAHKKALGDLGWDEFRLMVLEGLDKVKAPLGTGALADALTKADQRPMPACANRYVSLDIKRVVRLCSVLQEIAGDMPFFLAGNALAEVIGVALTTAAAWLRLLVRDDILVVVTKWRRGKANEYRYIRQPDDTPASSPTDDVGPYAEGY